MRHWHRMMAIGLLAVSAACSGKDTTAVPPDTTITPPPPPPGPNPPPPPPTSGPVTLFAAANIASCGNTRDEATARLLDSDTTAVVFALGDNAFPNGTAANYTNCYATSWGRHKARTYAVLGNHEYDSSQTAEGARAYFGDRVGSNGKGYYSLNVGAWKVIVLNLDGTPPRGQVEYNAGSEQQAWLATELAANQAKCTIAIWHSPRWLSSNTPGFFERTTQASVWAQLYNAGVEVVLNGSQHQYERMLPMDASGQSDPARGIVQFNVGTGGESITMPAHVVSSSAALGDSYGVLKLTLNTDSYAWEFLPIPGYSFTDAGSGTCH